MRLGDRPVIETEHGFDSAIQFIGQLHRADPSAVRAAGVFKPLQVHAKGGIELRHRARQDHSAPRRMLLDDREPMIGGEFPDGGHVVAAGAVLLLERLAAEMTGGALPFRQILDVIDQRRRILATQQDGHLESLIWIGLAHGLCPRQRLALAACE